MLLSEITLGCLYLVYGFIFNYNFYFLLIFDVCVMVFSCYFAVKAEAYHIQGNNHEMMESI